MVSGKKTRKNKVGKILSIPELRKSFHDIETYLGVQLKSGKAKTEDISRNFCKEWRKIFGRELSLSAARSYIQHMRDRLPHMKGGSQQLMGAPLDHTLQPGIYGPSGSYPAYVNNGFWSPEPGIAADCGVKDFSPKIPINMGSNQAGGRRRKTRRQRGGMNVLTGAPYAAEMRPFIAHNPATFQAGIQDSIKGLPSAVSSDPVDTAYTYRMPPVLGSITGYNTANLTRNVQSELTVLS